jgi:DeoR family fructose operon transcriptional repressor
VFLGADGLSLSAGMTTPDLNIAVTERSMIQNTRGKVIVMAEHAKFGLVAQVAVAPLRQIDVIITNREVPADFRKDLEKLNIELIVA